jgi:predicted transposase/invertase (TIGR01784 family)
LNAFLCHAKLNEIVDLEIRNPYQASMLDKMKDTYVDIKATDSTGRIFIIEMQMLSVAGFEKRILYNTAKAYAGQINKGQSYTKLFPVISINFCDFNLFSDMDYFHHFNLYDKNRDLLYSDTFNLLFVELKKVDKFKFASVSLEQAWLDFMNNVRVRSPKFKEIETALSLVKRTSLNKKELDKIEGLEMYALDYQRKIKEVRNEGLKEGVIKVAKNMLKQGFEINVIAKTTGLSSKEIKLLIK